MHWNRVKSYFTLVEARIPDKILHTHAPDNLPTPAIAYFINTLDSQRALGMAGAGQIISKLGASLEKYVPHSMPIFEKKISSDTSCGRSQTFP